MGFNQGPWDIVVAGTSSPWSHGGSRWEKHPTIAEEISGESTV